MTNVIFLDIDGPMIPSRALYLPDQDALCPGTFDPCAVSLVNRLAKKTNSKIVIHSHWRKSRDHRDKYPDIKAHLISQGIQEEYIAEEYLCPGDRTTDRWEDIMKYLETHTEVTRYVIIEDLPLKIGYEGLKPALVPIRFDEGFGWTEYNKALRVMGQEEESLLFC